MLKTVTMVTVFALALAGCSGGTPLTAEQKQQFQSTMQSSGRGASAAKAAAPGGASFVVALDAIRTATDPKVSEMAGKLGGGACDIQFTPPSTTGSNPSFSLRATGANCPIELSQSFNMQINQSAGSVNATIALSYAVKSDDFKALNDVTGFTLNGTISGSRSGASFNMSGKITSQLYGEIPIGISGNMSESGGDITMTVTFPTFVVELRAQSGGSGEPNITLNGQKITMDEFNSEFPSGTGVTSTSQGSLAISSLQSLLGQ